MGREIKWILQRLDLNFAFFHIFINYLGEEVEWILFEFADDTKLSGITTSREDRTKIQNNLERVKKCIESNNEIEQTSANFFR